MNESRTHCLFCGTELSTMFSLLMPAFMGINNDDRDEVISPMTFCSCDKCGEVQIKELLDLDLLYHDNHNVGVIGKTWENHYNALAALISEHVQGKIVLEISDPSAKIAKKITGYKDWYIVEPNPETIIHDKVTFIPKFFDKSFEDVKNVDVIIHSHLLEHIHNPVEFFDKCYEVLNDDGIMFISVPNMGYLVDNGYAPINTLHFEHTYFLNDEVLRCLALNAGFLNGGIVKYGDHSVFYKLKKTKRNFNIGLSLDVKKKFIENHEKHKQIISNTNHVAKECARMGYKVYLFGAHVSSQYYLYNGLDASYITDILDNAKNKQGHKLYGIDLSVCSPEIIANEHCAVICSHTSVYASEISTQLQEINKNVVIL